MSTTYLPYTSETFGAINDLNVWWREYNQKYTWIAKIHYRGLPLCSGHYVIDDFGNLVEVHQ